jgi:uncharacterized repeat protein (TIGR01451 family)
MKDYQIPPHRRPGLARFRGLWSLTSALLFFLLAPARAAAQGTGTPPEDQPPVVTGFAPNTGSPGTEVTVTGEHLAGATGVEFNGLAAVFQGGFSGTNLVATVPLGATTGPITIVTPSGTNTTLATFTVTMAPAPEITDFSPESGEAGVSVVINGLNLSGATSVRFNGVEADFTLFGNTITAHVPQTASTGPITVVTASGSSTSSNSFLVTTFGAPVITNVTPLSGRPGTRVTLSGQNLASVTSVRFHGVAAAFDVFGLAIVATVPEAASTGVITILAPNGSATSPGAFTVINSLTPEITGFTPNFGGPGTLVKITGTNLMNVTEVLFGGAAAQFTLVSASELNATVPSAATTGALTVSAAVGTAVSSDVFYVAVQILSFEPKHGPVGTTVSIQGLNFTGAIAVLCGGVSASFTNVSPTEIRATVPEGATSGAISIATPAGFVQSDTNFLLPPKILDVNPPSGPTSSDVTITGENLLEATAVQFAGTSAVFTPALLTSVVATVPASAQNGPITVTTPAGSATSLNSFYVGRFSDLAVGMTALPVSVSVGDFLSYTLQVSNHGPLEASDVVLSDLLPSGAKLVFLPSGADCFETNNLITCQLGTVPAGADLTFRVSVQITDGPYLTNQVSVTSSSADPNLADNAVSLLTILKGAPPIPILTNVTLAITVSGNALELSWPSAAPGFVVETTPSLAPPVQWSGLADTPVVSNGKNTVTLARSSRTSFFRLRNP